jgi:hypothetical protein
MKSIKKFSRKVIEVNGEFVRSDGFTDAPLNVKRVINTSKLTKDILEAKNFNFFPEDTAPTMQAFPKANLNNYQFEMTCEKV